MARLRGFVWLSAGVVLALLAGLVAYTSLARVTETSTGTAADLVPSVSVFTAARSLPTRSVLTLDDLVAVEMPADIVPDGAVRTSDMAVAGSRLPLSFPANPSSNKNW